MLAVPFDQRQHPSVDHLFECLDDRFGRIDVLANIVGIYPNERVETMSDEYVGRRDFDEIRPVSSTAAGRHYRG